MKKLLISFLLVCATFSSYASTAKASSLTEGDGHSPTSALNPVIQWNKALLVIVRTPGAQPATMHSTRSFAIMHAAIYDAVNAIDQRQRRDPDRPSRQTLNFPPRFTHHPDPTSCGYEFLRRLGSPALDGFADLR